MASSSGNVLRFQFLVRGKTVQTHAEWPAGGASKVLYQNHTANKMHTSETFRGLFCEVQEQLKDVKEMIRVAQDYPAVLIVDWVASHRANSSFEPVHGLKRSGHLFQSIDFSDIFAFFVRRGRSHITNPPDHLIHLSLRKCYRESFRDRDVQHGIAVHKQQGSRPAAHEPAEAVIKGHLLKFVLHWISAPLTAVQTCTSWTMALTPVLTADSVNEMPLPPAVILLPPPLGGAPADQVDAGEDAAVNSSSDEKDLLDAFRLANGPREAVEAQWDWD